MVDRNILYILFTVDTQKIKEHLKSIERKRKEKFIIKTKRANLTISLLDKTDFETKGIIKGQVLHYKGLICQGDKSFKFVHPH